MLPNRTLRRHADLVDRMADALGVDLEEAVMRGALNPDALPDMVLRCSACTKPEQCEGWLARTPAPAGPEAAPDYCRNAEVFDVLARR